MPKYKRSLEELTEALNDQRFFLRASAQSFDDGHEKEARRIATVVYTICQDSGSRTHSILSQMNIKKGMTFISSARTLITEGNEFELPSLALASVLVLSNGRGALLPDCHCAEEITRTPMTFDQWWEEPIFQEIHQDTRKRGRVLTRKNLVFHLRSQDGGAHYDGEIQDNPYLDLAVRKRIGMYRQLPDGSVVPFDQNPHLASMRQIAWELEQTLAHLLGGPTLPPFVYAPTMRQFLIDNPDWVSETFSVNPLTSQC